MGALYCQMNQQPTQTQRGPPVVLAETKRHGRHARERAAANRRAGAEGHRAPPPRPGEARGATGLDLLVAL